MVGGDSPVPSGVGQGSCGFCATPPPRQSEGGVLRRWSSLLACSATRAFAESLLETRPVPRIDAVPSTHEVLRDAFCERISVVGTRCAFSVGCLGCVTGFPS